MMFGAWGNPDHDESIGIIHAALDAGINFVDTADVCSAGESEEIVGKALKGRSDNVVLATKFFVPMGEDPNQRIAAVDRHRGRELAATAGHRLHRPLPGAPPDPDVDVDETLGALTDLVRQGKVRYIGSSWSRARRSSRRSGRPASGAWSAPARAAPVLAARAGIELDVLPTAQRHGMGILTYSTLAGGWSGSWSAESSRRHPRDSAWPRASTCRCRRTGASSTPVEQLAKVAEDAGISMIELAIAFVPCTRR